MEQTTENLQVDAKSWKYLYNIIYCWWWVVTISINRTRWKWLFRVCDQMLKWKGDRTQHQNVFIALLIGSNLFYSIFNNYRYSHKLKFAFVIRPLPSPVREAWCSKLLTSIHRPSFTVFVQFSVFKISLEFIEFWR